MQRHQLYARISSAIGQDVWVARRVLWDVLDAMPVDELAAVANRADEARDAYTEGVQRLEQERIHPPSRLS